MENIKKTLRASNFITKMEIDMYNIKKSEVEKFCELNGFEWVVSDRIGGILFKKDGIIVTNLEDAKFE